MQVTEERVEKTTPRECDEYKIALELELWREKEKENFIKSLHAEKIKQLTILKDEFKRRELERESSYRKKLVEYEKLELQLKKGVKELEDREKNITGQEIELTKLRDNIQFDRQRFILDQKSMVERMKRDAAHEISIEQKRSATLKEEIEELKGKILTISGEKEELRKEVESLHRSYNNRPDITAQNEVLLLRTEKDTLVKQLDNANKGKLAYKQKWTKAIQELAYIKQENQENEQTVLKKDQDELNLLKRKLLVNHEQQNILLAQQELNKLKISAAGDFENLHGNSPKPGINQRAARLMDERENLMKTGAYSNTDFLITQLDKQIKEALQ